MGQGSGRAGTMGFFQMVQPVLKFQQQEIFPVHLAIRSQGRGFFREIADQSIGQGQFLFQQAVPVLVRQVLQAKMDQLPDIVRQIPHRFLGIYPVRNGGPDFLVVQCLLQLSSQSLRNDFFIQSVFVFVHGPASLW